MATALRNLAPWLALLPLAVALHSPRLLALELGIAAGVLLVIALTQRVRIQWVEYPAAVALLVFSGYAILSVAWSFNPLASLGKPLFTSLMIAGVVVGLELSRRASPAQLQSGIRWALVFAFLGLGFACFEVWSSEYLQRKLFTAFPRLYAGIRRHVMLDDQGVVTALVDTNIKRRLAMVMLWIWPMALGIRVALPQRFRVPAWSVLAILAIVTIMLGQHFSSRLALAVGAAVLAGVLVHERLSLKVVAAGWIGLVLVTVPLGLGLHAAKLYEAEWLTLSARARVVIWNATATEYWKRPLVGVGADATIKLQPEYERAQGGRRESWFLVTIERHAHNAYLQVWYELGAIGALLLCAVLLALVRALQALPRPARPFAAAYLTSCGALLFSSYGLWQFWLQSSIALGAFALLVAARALPPPASEG